MSDTSNLTEAEKIQAALCEPFEEHDIEWRVQQSGVSGQNKDRPWVIVIPYLTNRAVQQRLDDVLGFDGWENSYQEAQSGKGYLCTLKIRIGDKWITKQDGAEYTQVEPLKGALSGAMKRVAVQFGIGRYLYSLGDQFPPCTLCDYRKNATGNFINIKLDKRNKQSPTIGAQWFTPELPEFALPKAKFEKELNLLREADTLEQLKKLFLDLTRISKSLNRSDITNLAVSIKEDRKVLLEQKEKASREEAVIKFNSWYKDAVKVKIRGSENESILDKNFKDTKAELTGWCKQLNLNVNENIAALTKQYDDRKNSLKTGE